MCVAFQAGSHLFQLCGVNVTLTLVSTTDRKSFGKTWFCCLPTSPPPKHFKKFPHPKTENDGCHEHALKRHESVRMRHESASRLIATGGSRDGFQRQIEITELTATRQLIWRARKARANASSPCTLATLRATSDAISLSVISKKNR